MNLSPKLGPWLMLGGMALLVTVLLETLELLPLLNWSQATNAALASVAILAYGLGFLIDGWQDLWGVPDVLDGVESSSAARCTERWRTVAFVTSYAFMAVVFVGLKWAILDYDPGKVLPDTHSYVQVAGESLTSPGFWTGSRPFTVPLVYKLLGVTVDNFKQTEVMNRIAHGQFVLSAVGWMALSIGVAAATVGRRARMISFGLILLFALSLHVSQWDRLPISESISTSLFAASVGWHLLGARWKERLGHAGLGLRLAFFTILLALLVLFLFSRDSHVVMVSLAAIGAASLSFARWKAEHWWPPWVLGASALLVLACVVQYQTVQIGGRWRVPFYHILQDRILPDPEARGYFEDHGMPDGALTEEALGMGRNEFIFAMRGNPRFTALSDWVDDRGRSVYTSYLLSVPFQTVTAPLREAGSLVSPISTEYRHQEAVTPTWLEWLTAVTFPRSMVVIGMALVLFPLGVVYLYWKGRFADRFWIPLGIVLTSYPLMLVAWYGDSIEVERHAYQAAMQLRVGLLILAIWLAQFGVNGLKDKFSSEAQVLSS